MTRAEFDVLAEEGLYEVVAARPALLTHFPTHYCPGCNHDTAHRILAELIEELDIAKHTTLVWPVGCSAFGAWYFTHKIDEPRPDMGGVDSVDAPHGRAPAVATGIKRAKPQRIVISYHGDGDFAAIGTSETVHMFNRGENITAIFINNAIYGMTGGQMAPTTLPGQKSTTSPYGRTTADMGHPIRMCELLATLDGTLYAERVAVTDPKSIQKAKRAIRRGIELQMRNNQTGNRGASLIELLIGCPTNWGMTPEHANDFVREEMTRTFPPGIIKEPAPL